MDSHQENQVFLLYGIIIGAIVSLVSFGLGLGLGLYHLFHDFSSDSDDWSDSSSNDFSSDSDDWFDKLWGDISSDEEQKSNSEGAYEADEINGNLKKSDGEDNM